MTKTKITTRVDQDLYKRARILAIERGMSYEALFNQALKEYVERAEQRRKK